MGLLHVNDSALFSRTVQAWLSKLGVWTDCLCVGGWRGEADGEGEEGRVPVCWEGS